MSEMKFTDEHEWLRIEEDGNVTMGITDFAQDQLGDVVYVELPEVNQKVMSDEEIAVVESVKAAGDIKTPISGVVIEINATLEDQPEKVNTDPTGEGWFFKLKPGDLQELDGLMDEAAYNDYLNTL